MRVKTVYILLLSSILLCLIVVMLSSFRDAADPTAGMLSDTHIIIDAGHGGEDGGAVAGDVLEKDLNLSIALRLSRLFRDGGFDVTDIRSEDISVYTDDADTLSQKKTSDLHNRLAIFNSDERNIVISIHQNMFDDPRYSGTQVFYAASHDDSALLAECIRAKVVERLQPDNTRACKKADSNIYILYNATVPAVLVECGFLSNPDELNRLTDESYQQQLALSIYEGFLDYYDNRR